MEINIRVPGELGNEATTERDVQIDEIAPKKTMSGSGDYSPSTLSNVSNSTDVVECLAFSSISLCVKPIYKFSRLAYFKLICTVDTDRFSRMMQCTILYCVITRRKDSVLLLY